MAKAQSPPATLTTADRALLRAIRAWGGDDVERILSRISPRWADRIASGQISIAKISPEAAWDAMRQDHVMSSRPDPTRIHPSWYIRALHAESRAVQIAVANHAPKAIQTAIRREFPFNEEDLATDRPTDPEVLRWALALWTERLVGDVARSTDDPPVILALASLPRRELARLFKVTGLVKHSFAIEGSRLSPQELSRARLTSVDRVRLGCFRRHIGQADSRLVPVARADLAVMADDHRRGYARLGLLTFGRLLAVAETHRSRWALQHLPYPIARLIREKTPAAIPQHALIAWENWVLEAAWTRLLSEGRLIGSREGFA